VALRFQRRYFGRSLQPVAAEMVTVAAETCPPGEELLRATED
jgi:hypothetical protein